MAEEMDSEPSQWKSIKNQTSSTEFLGIALIHK